MWSAISHFITRHCSTEWEYMYKHGYLKTATISLPFSKYPKHFAWSGFKQNNGKLQRIKADASRLSTDCLSSILILAFWLCKPRWFITPRISGCKMDTWPADARAFSRPALKPGKRPWERGCFSPMVNWLTSGFVYSAVSLNWFMCHLQTFEKFNIQHKGIY